MSVAYAHTSNLLSQMYTLSEKFTVFYKMFCVLFFLTINTDKSIKRVTLLTIKTQILFQIQNVEILSRMCENKKKILQ